MPERPASPQPLVSIKIAALFDASAILSLKYYFISFFMSEISRFQGLKLKDLSDADAEKVLVEAGFPAGSARIAKSGWSGNTEVNPIALATLLAGAIAEAEAQSHK